MEIKTKKDIINEFLVILDNSDDKEEIYKTISRDEIERRLNVNIQGIEYTNNENSFDAEYNPRDKKIIFNKTKHTGEKFFKLILVHEMWHAIVNRPDGMGLYRIQNDKVVGEGIDEGFTQLMTERMLGYSSVGTYQFEKETTAVLEKLVGGENLMSDYIYGTSKTKEKMEEKYGQVGEFDYRILRKFMDERLVLKQKADGIYRNKEERQDKEQLIEKMKEKEARVKELVKYLLLREKLRVEEANSLDGFEKYDKLLKTLSFCTELKDIEEFDLEEEIRVNSERLGKIENRNLKEFEETIEEVTSEVTISEINSQLRKHRRLLQRF